MAGIGWRCVLTADQYVGLGKLYYTDKPWAQNKKFSSRAQGRISKTNKLRGFLQPRVEKKVDMNRTLFDCGIKKSIETRKGEKFDITSVLPKSLERLDLFSELKVKKKWEKVAEERGVSKSLVVKWNKNRNKIKAESERNKRKENSGGVKATRQRRKLIGDKAKNSEKYPLASARVIVDFKLRRAKGCKVSKLWLKKKMKSYIEECYGKEHCKN